MTSDLHERCTDRVSEAVGKLNFEVKEDDLVIMVQGDEILITPNMINSVINDYIEHKAPATNLLSRIYNNDDYQDPNVVKVVSSFKQQALYLSRAPIPSNYRDKSTPIYQQTGVIAFKRQFLDNFSNLPQTPLEKIESIDMLRILEHELTLRVVYTENETIAVDIPSDLIRAEEILKKDHLLKQYA
jgi:3-deoxy-manno-octulosonate cytidylyltransferase (CMP-KDO synthetase)